MDSAQLVRELRTEAGLSIRGLADAAGVASSTVHRIEQGRLHPTVDMLDRLAEAAGARLRVTSRADYAASLVGLARALRDDIAAGESSLPVRRAAELAHRFHNADADTRRRMIAARPPDTGDQRWDAFVAALGEWLALHTGTPVPGWVHEPDRYFGGGWWVTSMKSMRAWEYAGSPAPFKSHGVYLHRQSLLNV
jgi:transcriptional regulator with XRE-family HTH domain